MSLPLSDIVKVDISVSPTLAPLAGFGELLFLTNDVKDLDVIPVSEGSRKFKSLKEVQDAFKDYPKSECIKAATSFYAQSPQPVDFTVGVMAAQASHGALIGGEHATLEELKKQEAATFKITVDTTEKTLSNLNFSGNDSLESIALTIETELQKGAAKGAKATNNIKCIYSGGKFVIISGTTGNSSHVSYATTEGEVNYAQMLGLSVDKALSDGYGVDIETPSQALGEITNVSGSFTAVVTHKSLRDDADKVDEVAAWCEANKKLFMNTTNNMKTLVVATQTDTVAKKLKDKAYRYTITTFSRDVNEYPSASLFGRIATVNYEGTNTTITLKFKKLPSVAALKLTGAQKAALDNVNVGGFMSFGGNSMYAEARMADGGWIDAVHGLLWLEDRIKKGVFNLMYGTATKVPYNDTGINMVVQRVTTALEQGVRNGLLSAGNTPEGEFLPAGYKIEALSSTEVAAEDKSNRIYRGITFKCIGAGALHNVIISGSFSE